MATKLIQSPTEEDPPLPKTLREEALEVVKEWRDELKMQYENSPSESLVPELYIVAQIVALLEPTATHYQT